MTPFKFWKTVCWVENGTLMHKAFILGQRGALEAAGPLEMTFIVPAGVKEATVQEIESLVDLNFVGIA